MTFYDYLTGAALIYGILGLAILMVRVGERLGGPD